MDVLKIIEKLEELKLLRPSRVIGNYYQVVYGNGEIIRDYIYVDDAIKAIKLYTDLAVKAILDGLEEQLKQSGADLGASLNPKVEVKTKEEK